MPNRPPTVFESRGLGHVLAVVDLSLRWIADADASGSEIRRDLARRSASYVADAMRTRPLIYAAACRFDGLPVDTPLAVFTEANPFASRLDALPPVDRAAPAPAPAAPAAPAPRLFPAGSIDDVDPVVVRSIENLARRYRREGRYADARRHRRALAFVSPGAVPSAARAWDGIDPDAVAPVYSPQNPYTNPYTDA